MSFFAQYPASSGGTSTNPSIGTNGAPAPSESTQVAGQDVAGDLIPLLVGSDGTLEISASALPLPAGAATEATLYQVNLGVTDISTILEPGQQTMDGSVPVTIASDQSTINVKVIGSIVPVAFDYQAISYVGATTNIDTVTYKTGGSGGTTVATLTMGYDGSSRLTSVTRT